MMQGTICFPDIHTSTQSGSASLSPALHRSKAAVPNKIIQPDTVGLLGHCTESASQISLADS